MSTLRFVTAVVLLALVGVVLVTLISKDTVCALTQEHGKICVKK